MHVDRKSIGSGKSWGQSCGRSAIIDANGVATTTLPLASSQANGAGTLQASFAGDSFEQASQATAAVTVYQPTSFVIWGGNTPGLAIGQRINFWGSTWNAQATGGNYTAGTDFLGFATPVHGGGTCEPSARTTGATILDFGCWTAKPATASPPATLPTYISVLVATSIGEVSGRVYGNIAAVVVLQVDTSPAYGPGLNQQGFGTIRAVIEDGAGLFPPNAVTEPLSELHEPGTSRASLAGTIASLHFDGLGLLLRSSQAGSPRHSLSLAPAETREEALGDLGMTGTEKGRGPAGSRPSRVSAVALDPGSRRYSFYSHEMNLLAESELTTASAPAILYEYIWFNGHPVAQLDGGTLTHWTFTDHLGTPLLQTDSAGAVFWRAEHEPFGTVFALRTADQHQPLRLPGQEAEQLNLGNNGLTDRSYNIFRWYRSTWGRYSQADPIGLLGGLNLLAYGLDDPLDNIDSNGLDLLRCSRPINPRLLGSRNPNSFRRHVFLFSTNAKRGCGQAAKHPLWGGFLSLFFPIDDEAVLEPDNPFDSAGGLKPGYECQTMSRDADIEKCALAACSGSAPRYNLCRGPACFDWVEDVVSGCQCHGGYAPPSYAPPPKPKPTPAPCGGFGCVPPGWGI